MDPITTTYPLDLPADLGGLHLRISADLGWSHLMDMTTIVLEARKRRQHSVMLLANSDRNEVCEALGCGPYGDDLTAIAYVSDILNATAAVYRHGTPGSLIVVPQLDWLTSTRDGIGNEQLRSWITHIVDGDQDGLYRLTALNRTMMLGERPFGPMTVAGGVLRMRNGAGGNVTTLMLYANTVAEITGVAGRDGMVTAQGTWLKHRNGTTGSYKLKRHLPGSSVWLAAD